MDRNGYLLLFAIIGMIYMVSALVILWRSISERRLAWLGHVFPLAYVGGTYLYLFWLAAHEASAMQAVELFVWGQLVLGIWLLIVQIQHFRRWDKFKQIAPSVAEMIDAEH